MVSVTYAAYYGLRQLHNTHKYSMSDQWRMDFPVIYRLPCDAWYSHAKVVPCMFGKESAPKTVVLLGDSIGVQWFSMVPEIFRAPHWRVIVFTKSACPMVDEDIYYKRIGRIYKVCSDWRNAVLDRLKMLKPDVLIMGSSVGYDFSESQWIEGSARILERVNDIPAVFIIPGTPVPGFHGPGCLSRSLLPGGLLDREACLTRDRMQKAKRVTGFLEQAANQFDNAYMLDLNELVCPGGDCNAVQEGAVVFRDGQHLTDSFVRAQIPFIRDRLERLAPLR